MSLLSRLETGMNSPAGGRLESRPHTFLRFSAAYIATTTAMAAAFLIRQALSLAVGPGLPPYIIFYPAVMLVALTAGAGPGLLATIVGGFISIYWILPSQGHFAFARAADTVGLAIFLGMGVFMSIVADLYRRTRQKAAASLYELSLRITERKRAEKALSESAERFRGTLDNMLEGAQIVGFDWRYLYLNKTAQEHNRRPNEELLGRKYQDMWPGIEGTDVFRVIQLCLEDRCPHRMENEFVFPDGTIGWFELGIQPVSEGVFIHSEDISERKRSEKLLRDNQHLLQAVIDLVPQFIFAKDRSSRHLFVNRVCAEANGMTPDQMIGLCDLDLVATRDQAEKFMRDDRRVIESGEPMTGVEERMTDAAGRTRILQTTKIPFTLPGTVEPALVGVAVDITELKQAEEEVLKLNAELEHRVEKRTVELKSANEELEAFSYSVSHDLRAPLRHISGFLELLQKSAGGALQEDAQRYLGIIRDSAKKMGVLIDDLIAFSRIGRARLNTGLVRLNAVVAEVISDLAHEASGRDVQWIVRDLPEIEGDRNLLKLAFMNLLDNALKYTRPRDTATIEVSSEMRGDIVVIQVRDNGVGFDPRGAEKLFGVFQRLHSLAEFEGTGIGLANVRRIVSRHGGETWAESEPGKGSIFSFSLPKTGTAAG